MFNNTLLYIENSLFSLQKKKEHFEIVIYSADKWQQYFVSGISNI